MRDIGYECNSVDIDNCAVHGIGTPWREAYEREQSTELCRTCGNEVKVQIQKNTGYCCPRHKEIDDLLTRYRELQSLEGVSIEAENAIAREQGQVWRAYLKACKKAGLEPASSENPRLGAW